MHSSRRLQLEQATLMAWGFMLMTFTAVDLALDQGYVFDTKNQGFHGSGGSATQFMPPFDVGQDPKGYIPAQ